MMVLKCTFREFYLELLRQSREFKPFLIESESEKYDRLQTPLKKKQALQQNILYFINKK